jgi:hypothetical protein
MDFDPLTVPIDDDVWRSIKPLPESEKTNLREAMHAGKATATNLQPLA